MVFWSAVLPVVPARRLGVAAPAHALDRSADGCLLTGGTDRFVRAWEGRRPFWSMGSSLAFEREYDRTWAKAFVFGSYGPFDFAAGESLDPVVERFEPEPGDQHRLRTEIFGGSSTAAQSARRREWATWRALRSSPAAISGHAVVVSEDHGTEWTLALWSPRQDRFLKHLGRYPKATPAETVATNH